MIENVMMIINQLVRKVTSVFLESSMRWLAFTYLKCSCLPSPNESVLRIHSHSFLIFINLDGLKSFVIR